MEIAGNVVVTDTDREMARQAIVDGWNNCKLTNNFPVGRQCECDCGAIDGCQEKVEAVAKYIAAARRL